ncbi:thymidine phosphorylase [Mycoplasma sp. SG1]|uniref:thymidine phosphorylase n=1 Tax=Mycoplasma sp. SG1 TaxID=2810348 RepID=UPI0020247CCC|nr:thymidine phosphorylase [Mycoplasma sp. SG1]URM53169.1 thymidine phosphorylase [Mycoplasma sp. SG1]
MNIQELISKKKHNRELSAEEIHYIVNGAVSKIIPDYQISAFLMAVWFNKLTSKELYVLTKEMMDSGDYIKLNFDTPIVDKHSSGGIGDKISLIFGPIIAALGYKFAKLSGRGLGQTGGTLDKLESIPSFNVALPFEKFKEIVTKDNFAIAGQTANLVPADKIFYALRDVTETVDCNDLIASSIMSKKLVVSSDILLLDVKCGSGAFCPTYDIALDLATKMMDIANSFNKKLIVEITDMNDPLGHWIGNEAEVREAVEVLLTKKPHDIYSLIESSIVNILQFFDPKLSKEEAKIKIGKCFDDKSGYNYFLKMVKNQGGDVEFIKNFANSELTTKYQHIIKAPKSGYLKFIDAAKLGILATNLGAGRHSLEDKIDMKAAIYVYKKSGEEVKEGEPILKLFTNKNVNNYQDLAYQSFEIHDKPPIQEKLIKKVLRNF